NGPITRWVTEHRQRVVITDVSQDPRIGDCNLEYQTAQIRSALMVPVQTKERLHAILYINQCSHVRYWSKDDQELAQAVADQLAISIQQAYLYTQVQQQAETSRAQAQQLSQTLLDLQHTQAQLIQSEKMSSLGRMVAGVAHEINNPVSFIYGNIPHVEKYVEGLMQLVQLYRDRTPEDEELRSLIDDLDLDFLLRDLPDTLRSMQTGAERIRQIVLSLRRFARLDEAEWKLADLHDSLDTALDILKSQIPLDVTVRRHYSDLPWVECYPQLLNQVFVNIVGNALDALADLPDHHPKFIDITTALYVDCETRQTWMRIAIADNGPGIAPEHQTRIFDPFFTTKDVGRGTGLGLTVSYQTIVHQHRGHIGLVSTPQGGTEITLDLPIYGTGSSGD
ncbi:MAG TPA: ATP-binding protein, partial [Candidatus Obscuribacterales bacterium]